MSSSAIAPTASTTPPLVLTMGEPAGIGAEITLAAWTRRRDNAVPPFVLLDDVDRIEAMARRLGWSVPVARVDHPREALPRFAEALPVLHRPVPVPVEPGRPDAGNAGAVRDSIAEAVALVRQGDCAAVVTNPINKDVLQGAGFAFPGHTEFLADLAGGQDRTVMMLACPGLRVVPVTIHIPLSRVAITLTTEAIVETGRVTARALARDFGLAAPRLAVAALNPHAGEHGRMGDEETRIIQPAVDLLRAEGLTVTDPAPADTLFHAAARTAYDAVLCMYHDQALIPLKTIDFAGGVNVTLGLPFVRTSPDHGTAFDIAGQGRADPTSLIAALRMAAVMAARRGTAP